MTRLPSLSAAALLSFLVLSSGCNSAPESEAAPLLLTPFAKSFSAGLAPQSLASGPEGDVFFGGRFGQNVDFGGGLLEPQPGGSVFIAHLDANGDHLFSGATGASGALVMSTAVGPQGDMFAGGSYQGAINFGSGKMTGKWNGFMAAFEKGGASHYSRNIGGKNQVFVDAVAAAPNGGVVLAARADDGSDFGAGAAASPQGTRQLVIASYGPTGTLAWTVRMNAFTVAQVALSVSADGNIVFGSASYQEFTFAGTTVANGPFVGKISADGQPLWLAGGETPQGGIPFVQRVAVDASGNVFAGGLAFAPFTLGGVNVPLSFNQQQGFLVKLDANGQGQFGKVFKSMNGVETTALAVLGNGDVLFAANAYAGIDFGGGWVGTGTGNDVILGRFSGDGTLQKAFALDGSGNEYLTDLAADPTGKPVILGLFDGVLDVSGTRLVADGQSMFVARLDL